MAITNNPTVNIDVDSTLAGIPGIQDTISETSIHNTGSVNLGQNREIDEYLKINKDEKINESQLENLKNEFAPTTNLEVANFADKRFISKQLSDKNDSDIITDLSREIHRSYETDIKLARAINLEDEEREIADAQIRADIAKEASERARIDADLANALAQYKYDMSQHITTRELDVNGDTRLNIEVVDGDTHGGNLNVETSLVVGSTNAENGTTTSEGKVIGDAHIKHDLFVDNDTTLGNDLLVENDSHIMNDLLVDRNATIEGNLDVNGTTTLNELEVENNLTVGGNLKVEGDTDLDKTLNVDGAVTLNDVLTVEKDTTLKDDLVVNKTATIDGATQLNDTLTVEKETLLNDTLTVEDATTLNDTLSVEKETTLNDTLTVEKATQFNDTLTAEGATTLKDVLDVKKSTTLEDTLAVEKSTQLNDTLTVEKATQLNDTLTVEKASQLNDTLDVKKAATLEDTLDVKKGTLLEDTLQVNKQTDIGTDQTNADLYVHGSEHISNNLNVTGTSNLGTTNVGTTNSNKNLTVNGSTFIKDQLNVENSTVLKDTLDVKSTTTIGESDESKHADLIVNGSLNVSDESTFRDNVAIGDERHPANLTVNGDETVRGSHTVLGDTHLSGNLSVEGTSNLGTTNVGTLDANKDLTINGNENLNGSLNVTGTSNLGTTNIGTTEGNKNLIINGNESLFGTLNVEGKTTLNNELEVLNATVLKSTLNVNGNTDLDGTLSVDGATSLKSTLNVTGKSTLGDLSAGTTDLGTTTVGTSSNKKNLTVNGNESVSGTLNVTGKSILGELSAGTTALGATTVGTSSAKKNLTVNGDANVTGTFDVDGKTTLSDLDVGTTTIGSDENNKNLIVKGNASISGTLGVTGKSTLGTVAAGATTIGTSSSNKNLTVNGNETVSGTLGVTGKSTLGTVAAGATTIGTTSANKNLTVNGNEIITGNLNVNTNTDLDGTLNVDGETTLNANVKIKDDSDTQKSFSDIIGTIKNALVKDFTQSYDPTTGKLTSTLEFNNFYSGNTNRPTVNTITKTINLDLEKYILDINDVYATKTVANGKTTYTDFDISTLTDEQIRELESPDYTGNIVRCLKVKYNTYNNANAGTEKAYVYFEINDIFRSISSKLELEINNEITARNNAITNAINNLDVASVGSNGGYIKTISESDGKISASRQGFDTSISSSSNNNNAPTSKAVYDLIGTLDVSAVGEDGKYIKTISEANGKISASAQSFDTTINANSTNNNAPTSKAVKTYADQAIGNAINALDSSIEVSDGSYLTGILQEDGILTGACMDFETVLTEVNNAPTSAAVIAGLNTKVDKIDGKQLSTEDYTSDEKTKLSGIEAGAQKNTVTGVKGNSETTYRVGNVNITKANIGLGNVDNTADVNKAVASAGKLTTARKVYVELGTASKTETKDFSGDTAIPVNGTLGAGNGGTGKTTLQDSANALINALSTGDSDPTDNDYFVAQYAGGGATTTTFHRRPISKLWNYIKSKLSITTSESGNAITSLSYSNGVFTVTKGSTFLTSHQDISGKINSTSIAPAFSKTKNYAVGSYVTYNSTLYKCTTAHSASDWNANHFTAVAVIDSFPTIDSALSSTSTNAVQNKVVNSALNGKVPTTRTVNGKALSADISLSASDVSAIASSDKGAVNGVASLNASGKVPTTQLSFESSISTASPSTTNAPTCKAIMDMLSNIQKTVTLKDASNNVLLQVKYLDLSGEGDKTYIINGSISLPTINVV